PPVTTKALSGLSIWQTNGLTAFLTKPGPGMQSNSPPTSQQLARHFLALRPLVASGVPPDVEGGILPPGRKSVHISAGGGGFQRLLRRTILAAGQDAPLCGRPEAR